MSQVGKFNIVFGFIAILLASGAGPFLGLYTLEGFNQDASILSSWHFWLSRSAHAHMSLLAMIQILVGLTLPYSALSDRIKRLQTLGLILGVIALGPLMAIKATFRSTSDFLLMDISLGVLLSSFYLALVLHVWGLVVKKR